MKARNYILLISLLVIPFQISWSVAKDKKQKTPAVFLQEGDSLFAQKQYGDAAARYEQAMYLDPQCMEAYLKYADVYQNVKPQLAIEMLQKALTNKPDFYLAYRKLGDVYSSGGYYGKAIEAYQTYLANQAGTTDDLMHYASALFFNKQYNEAEKLITDGLSKEPNNFLLNRLAFYNAFEMKNNEKGLQLATNFFQQNGGEFIWQDYLYYGRLLNATTQYDQALNAFQKALNMDSSRIEIYKDEATVYDHLDQASQAAKTYNQYVQALGENAGTTDYFQLGRYYYAAGSKDSLSAQVYLSKADSLFALVKSRVPDSYLGSFWQARVNAMMDPETQQGLAKPYYEAALISLEKEKDKHPKELVECYRYLGYYYYLKNDISQSKTYWTKVLAIEPDNEVAIQALQMK